jgi:hypothetical protein
MSIYSICGVTGEAIGTKLKQLLEQEGQPCSYCIAFFLALENGDALSARDKVLYGRHLVKDHGMAHYEIAR